VPLYVPLYVPPQYLGEGGGYQQGRSRKPPGTTQDAGGLVVGRCAAAARRRQGEGELLRPRTAVVVSPDTRVQF